MSIAIPAPMLATPGRAPFTSLEWLADKWMPDQAPGYFQKRDPNALPALDKILLRRTGASPKLVAANKPKFIKKA